MPFGLVSEPESNRDTLPARDGGMTQTLGTDMETSPASASHNQKLRCDLSRWSVQVFWSFSIIGFLPAKRSGFQRKGPVHQAKSL